MPPDRSHRQYLSLTLFALALILALLLLLRQGCWHGNSELHTLLETIAYGLALTAGTIALTRYYTNKSTFFLILGAGLVATTFLDGYHAVITSSFLAGHTRSAQWILTPWSGAASRMFLSLLMCATLWAKRADARQAIQRGHELREHHGFAGMRG